MKVTQIMLLLVIMFPLFSSLLLADDKADWVHVGSMAGKLLGPPRDEKFVSAWLINLAKSIETWLCDLKLYARSCLRRDKKEWDCPRILQPGKRLFKN